MNSGLIGGCCLTTQQVKMRRWSVVGGSSRCFEWSRKRR